MTEPNGPFDLDARIEKILRYVQMDYNQERPMRPGDIPQVKDDLKQLIRDVLQAVKPEREPEIITGHAMPILEHGVECYNQAIDELEANITNLLKGEL